MGEAFSASSSPSLSIDMGPRKRATAKSNKTDAPADAAENKMMEEESAVEASPAEEPVESVEKPAESKMDEVEEKSGAKPTKKAAAKGKGKKKDEGAEKEVKSRLIFTFFLVDWPVEFFYTLDIFLFFSL